MDSVDFPGWPSTAGELSAFLIHSALLLGYKSDCSSDHHQPSLTSPLPSASGEGSVELPFPSKLPQM